MVAPVLLADADAGHTSGSAQSWIICIKQYNDVAIPTNRTRTPRSSARNVFHGKVAALTPGVVGEPGLKPGMPATALIKASHVILGVPS